MRIRLSEFVSKCMTRADRRKSAIAECSVAQRIAAWKAPTGILSAHRQRGQGTLRMRAYRGKHRAGARESTIRLSRRALNVAATAVTAREGGEPPEACRADFTVTKSPVGFLQEIWHEVLRPSASNSTSLPRCDIVLRPNPALNPIRRRHDHQSVVRLRLALAFAPIEKTGRRWMRKKKPREPGPFRLYQSGGGVDTEGDITPMSGAPAPFQAPGAPRVARTYARLPLLTAFVAVAAAARTFASARFTTCLRRLLELVERSGRRGERRLERVDGDVRAGRRRLAGLVDPLRHALLVHAKRFFGERRVARLALPWRARRKCASSRRRVCTLRFRELRAQREQVLHVLDRRRAACAPSTDCANTALAAPRLNFDELLGVLERERGELRRLRDVGLVEFGELFGSVVHGRFLC